MTVLVVVAAADVVVLVDVLMTALLNIQENVDS